MRPLVHDCFENEVTGHLPPFKVSRVVMVESVGRAIVTIEGDFPPATEVRTTIVGVFLIDPYGSHCPFRVELAPTGIGQRTRLAESHKMVVRKTTQAVVVEYRFRDTPMNQVVGEW